MQKISAVLIAYNEEKKIATALKSLAFADEIIVIDSGSTDQTTAVAEACGAKVIFHPWDGYGPQRKFSIKQTANDWVLSLDCDEVITDALREEILRELEDPKYEVYMMPRLNYFFGKAIRKAGLYPDYCIRLFNKKYADFDDNTVHEDVISDKPIGKLKGNIEHFAYETIEQFIVKQSKYASLYPKKNFLKAVINPYFTFIKIYFFRLGFLEGKTGYIIAKMYASYTFWKYIR